MAAAGWALTADEMAEIDDRPKPFTLHGRFVDHGGQARGGRKCPCARAGSRAVDCSHSRATVPGMGIERQFLVAPRCILDRTYRRLHLPLCRPMEMGRATRNRTRGKAKAAVVRACRHKQRPANLDAGDPSYRQGVRGLGFRLCLPARSCRPLRRLDSGLGDACHRRAADKSYSSRPILRSSEYGPPPRSAIANRISPQNSAYS